MSVTAIVVITFISSLVIYYVWTLRKEIPWAIFWFGSLMGHMLASHTNFFEATKAFWNTL